MYRAQADVPATASDEQTNMTSLDEAFSETNQRGTMLIAAHLRIKASLLCNKGSFHILALWRWLSRSFKCLWAREHETFSTQQSPSANPVQRAEGQKTRGDRPTIDLACVRGDWPIGFCVRIAAWCSELLQNHKGKAHFAAAMTSASVHQARAVVFVASLFGRDTNATFSAHKDDDCS